jgi:K+-transporting ATPase ATPase B chain
MPRQGKGAVVLVAEGQVIPADGEVIDGAAVVDEGAITGVSGGVVREANSGRSAVLAGTLVVSGRILVRTTTGSR